VEKGAHVELFLKQDGSLVLSGRSIQLEHLEAALDTMHIEKLEIKADPSATVGMLKAVMGIAMKKHVNTVLGSSE
jgi:biopolymer transport protein ExbD